jgi:5-methylcytosine-specific restriction endonuclease McrA
VGLRTSSHLFAEIYIRDEWICGLCRKLVDRTLQHLDPMCASIDHITQVHQGGTNDLANLRLTHLVCNQRRPRKRTDPDATEFLRVGRWL